MEYDYYPDSEFTEKKRRQRPGAKKILKWIVIALIATVYAFIFIRIFIFNYSPKSEKAYLWTEAGVQAYNNDSGSFKILNQQIKSFSYLNPDGSYDRVVYNDITSDGYYKVSNFMYNEATKELMISLRFNQASLDNLRTEFKLSKTPDKNAYVFALETTDGYVCKYSYTLTKSGNYYYTRLVFPDVELSRYDTVDLNVYYIGRVTLSDPVGYLTIYDSRIPAEYYDVKKALPAKVSPDLRESPYFTVNE